MTPYRKVEIEHWELFGGETEWFNENELKVWIKAKHSCIFHAIGYLVAEDKDSYTIAQWVCPELNGETSIRVVLMIPKSVVYKITELQEQKRKD